MAAHHQYSDHDEDEVVVVMVPFPAQGHLNQLLHLARLISSSYGLPVHYVGAAIHNRQAMSRLHGWEKDGAGAAKIHFHDFQTPPFPSPPPNPNSPSHFPSHLQPSFNASSHLRQPLAALLALLSRTSRRVVVIHDSLMAYVVQDAVVFHNAESYSFHSVSAFATLFFRWETMGKPPSVAAEIPKHIQHSIPPSEDCFTDQFLDFVRFQRKFLKFNSGYVYNTCKAVETLFVDLLGREEINVNKKRHWAIGPFNPVEVPVGRRSGGSNRCLEWLDKQEENSVLYVSFGTTTAMAAEQIRELAIGLERSMQKFIWVLRDADKGDVFSGEREDNTYKVLPEGYEERVEGVGMVVREWAPQLEILGHPATGGFMSHCGWNSCMESMATGVPMAAWPMHSDQPRNTVLVTAMLGAGVVAREWARRKEVVRAGEVERVVRRLMASPEGEEVRKRAVELGRSVRKSAAEGGESRVELDSFISHITRSTSK